MSKRYIPLFLLLLPLWLTACGGSESSSTDEPTPIPPTPSPNPSPSRFSLTGQILVASNTATDNDVNDEFAPSFTK